MTCRSYRETLLDIARGVTTPAPVARDADAHAARCDTCRTHLERQRELTTVLGALRDEASSWSASSSLEQGLLQAIEAKRPASTEHAPARRVTRFWYAAAAAVLIAGVGLGLRGGNGGEPARRQAANVNRDATVELDRAAAIDEMPRSTDATRPREPLGRPVRRVRSHVAAARRDDTARTIEFLPIPTAIGLPSMESARIVRTEVPVSALPSYGLTIAPDAPRSAVQADLLIGQDGQARGIRLVNVRQEQITSRSEQ
ncbi:MAG: hypothetical protein ACREUZ_10740 [Burkholderiales bacterium]